MKAFELDALQREQAEGDRLYFEFLRVPSMSMGLYVLAAGTVDPQQPHDEDEIYYVVQGRAMVQVAEEDRPVRAGSIVYVAAEQPHRFHTIEEDLHLLVFFAPAETG